MSKVMAQNENPYIISCLSVIKLKSLPVIVFEILALMVMFDLKRCKGQGQIGTWNLMMTYFIMWGEMWLEYTSSWRYTCKAYNDIFQQVWPANVIPGQGHGIEWKLIYNFLTVHTMQLKSVSLIVFEIFGIETSIAEVLSVWTLTSI